MIAVKSNRNSPALGLQLSDQEAGCCPTSELAEANYKIQYNSLPTTFSAINVTINGTTETHAFVHTYSTPAALRQALFDLFVESTDNDGIGLFVDKGDILVYLDSFASDKLTIELTSGLAFVNLVSNLGTTAFTARTTSFIGCLHTDKYTLNDAIAINVGGRDLTLSTYASAALLVAAVNTQLAAVGYGTSKAIAYARTAAEAGKADLFLWVIQDTKVIIDGETVNRIRCKKIWY